MHAAARPKGTPAPLAMGFARPWQRLQPSPPRHLHPRRRWEHMHAQSSTRINCASDSRQPLALALIAVRPPRLGLRRGAASPHPESLLLTWSSLSMYQRHHPPSAYMRELIRARRRLCRAWHRLSRVQMAGKAAAASMGKEIGPPAGSWRNPCAVR